MNVVVHIRIFNYLVGYLHVGIIYVCVCTVSSRQTVHLFFSIVYPSNYSYLYGLYHKYQGLYLLGLSSGWSYLDYSGRGSNVFAEEILCFEWLTIHFLS